MILTGDAAAGVAAGSVTLAFRRWEVARVAAGDRFLSPSGIIAVDAVGVVDPGRITQADAAAAGFADAGALRRSLRGRADDPVYRIALSWAGPDPRIALAADADLDAETAREIDAALARLDAHRAAPWTRAVLTLIRERPETRAAELAAALGRETAAFKRDVRALKALGLTTSLETGYRLSPRGGAYLELTSE